MSAYDKTLESIFDVADPATPFVDRHSRFALAPSREQLGIASIITRCLTGIPAYVMEPALIVECEESGGWSPLPASLRSWPWGFAQEAAGYCLRACSPATDSYTLAISFASGSPRIRLRCADTVLGSRLLASGTGEDAMVFGVTPQEEDPRFAIADAAGWGICWRIRSVCVNIHMEQMDGQWFIYPQTDEPLAYWALVIEGGNRPMAIPLSEGWNDDIVPEFDQAWIESSRRWYEIFGRIDRPVGESRRPRILRAAAVLERTCYKGSRHGAWQGMVASLCSVSRWSGTAFFWDTGIGVLGLMEIDPKLAKDALRVLFTRQRFDGCVPTHAYEHAFGSTFYPQAPIISWAMLHLVRRDGDLTFVRELLPRVEALFWWNVRTQDHDRDGLIEARFTGQIADNAPQYDRYTLHLRPRPAAWNIYLPPVASVALNSFHYMDARCIAALYRMLGNEPAAKNVLAAVAGIPERFEQILWDRETEYYQDFDHQIGRFNRARVLTSLLPVWAGMPMPAGRAERLVRDNLLEPKRFWGERPFPYLAHDDPSYDPCGYWRGIIWPHIGIWMIELLWQRGLHAEAEEAAERLLRLMDGGDKILENYFSGDAPFGGGEADYQWSSATYIYLALRRYRDWISP